LLPLPQLLGLIFPCLIFSIISSAIGCLRVSIIRLLAALKSMLQLQFFRLLFIQMAVVPLLQLPFQRQIERSSVRIVAFGGIKQKVSRWIGIQLLEKSFGVRVVADYLDFAKVGFAGLVGASAGIGTQMEEIAVLGDQMYRVEWSASLGLHFLWELTVHLLLHLYLLRMARRLRLRIQAPDQHLRRPTNTVAEPEPANPAHLPSHSITVHFVHLNIRMILI